MDIQTLSLFFIFLVVAIATGYWLGRSNKRDVREIQVESQTHYHQSVTFLLNEQHDEAVRSFIDSFPVNKNSFETHLALAELMRRRGEFANAIKIHENALYVKLPGFMQRRVQMELAIDYLRSGIYDRADRLLQEIVANGKTSIDDYRKALRFLCDLYQEMSDWKLAIDAADRLTDSKFSSQADLWRTRQSHYSCEIAQSLLQKAPDECLTWIKNAERYDANNPRTILLHAQLAFLKSGAQAQKAVLLGGLSARLGEADSHALQPHFQLIMGFWEFCLQNNHEDELAAFLKHLFNKTSNPFVFYLYLKLFKRSGGIDPDSAFVASGISTLTTFRHFESLLNQLTNVFLEAETIKTLADYMEEGLNYTCETCGYSVHEPSWQCPSCKNWDTFQPQFT